MGAVHQMATAKEIVDGYRMSLTHPTALPKRMKEYQFPRFDEVMEEFREPCDDRWPWRV